MQPILRLLGRFELASGTGSALTISGARAQLLLARLGLAGNDWVDRATLSTMLWGERADAQARASLRQLIWTIRQALKPYPGALVAEGDLVRLDPVTITTDVTLFDKLALSPDTSDLEAALALYRGDLLDGIDLILWAPDGYFLHERNRLRDLVLKVTANFVTAYHRADQWEAALQASRRGLIIDPYDEGLHAGLVHALQKLGRHREAQGQDEAFRKRLKAELGIMSPPQATVATGRRPALDLVPRLAMIMPVPDPAAPLQKRPTRLVFGGIMAAVVMVAITLGIWWQTSGISPALPIATTLTSNLPTRNLAAYDQYLRAEALRRAAVEDDQLRSVLTAYRRAFTLDADFADAHAGYALVAVELWQRSLDSPAPSPTTKNEAYDSAGRALELDPENARALIVLSRIQAEDGARDNALTTARQATAAEPSSAEAHANLALILSYGGNSAEARTELKTLQRLDRSPRAEWILVFGQVAFADGRYASAIADFVTVWPMLPHNPLVQEHLAAALAIQGPVTAGKPDQGQPSCRDPQCQSAPDSVALCNLTQ